MWKRFRRRSLAPRRPAIFPEQIGLVMVTAGAIGLGIVAVWLLLR
jgi:hypothetical protein